MEVSPKTLREVEFREKMRGYHPEDVDHFLEQVAAGIEVLQDRLRQAVERAQRAEAAAAEAGGTDDTLRKTLVLAQRTADLAVQEAREQASRILASAEQQAQSILAEADEKGRRAFEESTAECKAELGRLEATRSQAAQDVETLQRWLEEHKAHLQASLTEALNAVERAGVLWPAPSVRQTDFTPRRLPPPVQAEPPAAPESAGPETVMWSPAPEEKTEIGSAGQQGAAQGDPEETGGRGVPGDPGLAERTMPDATDQAMDEFFDDTGDFDDDRRFGGRLRRRR